MELLRRIARLSGWLSWVTAFVLVAAPVVALILIWQAWVNPDFMRQQFADLPQVTEFSQIEIALVIVLALTLLVPGMLALFHMFRLFRRYASGEVLTLCCAQDILRIGQSLLGLGILALVVPTVQRLIFTLDNPKGQAVLAIGVSGEMVGNLLAGGLLAVIGLAMREAARTADENASFV